MCPANCVLLFVFICYTVSVVGHLETGDDFITRSHIICTVRQIFRGRLEQEGLYDQGMGHNGGGGGDETQLLGVRGQN
jgi:hypothetical protein